MFEDIAEAIAERPPEDRAFFEDDYVAETAMLPTALRDSLTAGMLSEDPAAQVAAGRVVAFENSIPHSPSKPLEHKFATFWDVTWRDVIWPGRDPVIPSTTF